MNVAEACGFDLADLGKGERVAVIVLGMHRSGTSAVAGALARLGIDFGEHLTPAATDNSKGYWEQQEVVAQHDRLLFELGSRWDDDRPLPSGWHESQIARAAEDALVVLLEREFPESFFFGMKDPRMCRLMPLWFRIFARVSVEPRFVLAFRNPVAVGLSIERRDGLHSCQSYLLWLQHVLSAERDTRGYRRCFVCYDDLVEQPESVAQTVIEALALPITPDAVRGLQQFIELGLRHHVTVRECHPPSLPDLAREVFDQLLAATMLPPARDKFDAASRELARSEQLFRARLVAIENVTANLGTHADDLELEQMRQYRVARLQIFLPTAEGYDEGASHTRYFKTGCYERVTVDLGGVKRAAGRIRIDPVSYPAVVEVAEIVVLRGDESLVWKATDPQHFAECAIGGTALRMLHPEHLKLLSFGFDPQIVLPFLTARPNVDAKRIEVVLMINALQEDLVAAVNDHFIQPDPDSPDGDPAVLLYAAEELAGAIEPRLRLPLRNAQAQTVRFLKVESLRPTSARRLCLALQFGPDAFVIRGIRIKRDHEESPMFVSEAPPDGYDEMPLKLPPLDLMDGSVWQLEVDIGAK